MLQSGGHDRKYSTYASISRTCGYLRVFLSDKCEDGRPAGSQLVVQ